MKVFFDIVTNHTADVIDYRQGTYNYIDKATSPYKDADGTVFDDAAYAEQPTFPAMDPATSFPYTPFYHSDADATVKVPAWLNDITNYHNRGDSTYAGESATYGDFVGLDDLFTEKLNVEQGMESIYKSWVDFGVDGFRIDTVKHVNMEFWQKFNPAMLAEADKIGNPDFFMFGEVYDARPSFMSQYTTTGKLPATLDFGFQAQAVNWAQGKTGTDLRDLYADDNYYTDTDSNAYELPTFLGNHDMGRVGDDAQGHEHERCRPDGQGQARRRPDVPHPRPADHLLRRRAGLHRSRRRQGRSRGHVRDPDRRSTPPSRCSVDPPGRSTGSTRRPAVPTHLGPGEDPREQRGALRRRPDPSVLQQLGRHLRGLPDRQGQAGRVRGRAQQRDDAEVGHLRDLRAQPGLRPDLRLRRQGEVGQRRAAHGHCPGPVGLGLAGQQPDGQAEVRAGRLPDQPECRATSSGDPGRDQCRHPGEHLRPGQLPLPAGRTTAWTPLGTDDNAPYGVYQDVTAYAKGTLLEYRAVAKDSANHISATSTYGIVGDPKPTGGGGGGVGPVTQPDNVSVAGDHNSEMGCAADWSPACDQAQLTLDPKDQIWKGTYSTIPAGNYAYKAAINKSWDENYGEHAVKNGGNISYAAPGGNVTFYYDHATHWVTSDAQGPIFTAPGSYQAALGCPGDWQPDCMKPWLEDPDGDGIFTWSTDQIPAGTYQFKVAQNLSWDVNYGDGGVAGGANMTMTVPSDGTVVTISFDSTTHVTTVRTSRAGARPRPDQAAGDLGHASTIAVPATLVPAGMDPALTKWDLAWSPTGGLTVDAEAITGGSSRRPLVCRSAIPAALVTAHPELAGYLALTLDKKTARQVPDIVQGQVAVGVFDATHRLLDATGVQIPYVLDDLYAARAPSRPTGSPSAVRTRHTGCGPRPPSRSSC